jgi:hypothetical protein
MEGASLNRIEAIKCQLEQTAEHIVGEGYSFATLRAFCDAFLDAHDKVAAELRKRETAGPVKGLLSGLAPNDGDAA